jgi:hypothetical protein
MSQVRRRWRVERLLQTEMVHYEDCIRISRGKLRDLIKASRCCQVHLHRIFCRRGKRLVDAGV